MGQAGIRERLRECCEPQGIALSAVELDLLAAYCDLLGRWNAVINLTALDLNPPDDRALERLLVEPLRAARHVPEGPIRWVDVGSGGGSPAVPLKIIRPGATLTLVESRSRKGAFLREVVRTLGLARTDVLVDRFDPIVGAAVEAGSVDLLTARAVRIDKEFLGTAIPLLKNSGHLVLFGAPASERFDGRRAGALDATLELDPSQPPDPLIYDYIVRHSHSGSR